MHENFIQLHLKCWNRITSGISFRLKLVVEKKKAHSPVRVVGLSTALANAGDVAEWLDISDVS